MADDYFKAELALNEDASNVVPNAVAEVFAMSDTGFTTPLALTDIGGVPMENLVANVNGVYPPFRVVSGETDVIARSGTALTPLTSVQGNKGDPGDPGPAGAGVNPAGSVAGQVLTSQGPTANPVFQNLPAATSGIAGAPTSWPSSFPAELHTHPAGQISDATEVGRQVMKAADAQAARAAIGAGTGNGTSNLKIGTGPGDAASGNHSHAASTLPFNPTGSLTATDVQGAIEQAAASGGGGTAMQPILPVFYASGAYPAQPATPPPGVVVRWFFGPVQYMGPTWPGVLDKYDVVGLT